MGRLIYGGAYIRTRFCVSNINHLLTVWNGKIVIKLVGLELGGLIFGGAYIRRFTVYYNT